MAAPKSVLAPPVAIDVVFSICYRILIKMFKKLLAKIKKVKNNFSISPKKMLTTMFECLFVCYRYTRIRSRRRLLWDLWSTASITRRDASGPTNCVNLRYFLYHSITIRYRRVDTTLINYICPIFRRLFLTISQLNIPSGIPRTYHIYFDILRLIVRSLILITI